MTRAAYAKQISAAIEKSIKWKMLDRGFCLDDLSGSGTAADAIPYVITFINHNPFPRKLLRVSCVTIHTQLVLFLAEAGIPCLPIVGDVLIDGVPRFNTSYQKLKMELNGSKMNSDEPFPGHVWLSFPDSHTIDVTLMAWAMYKELPENWVWSEHILCSFDEDRQPVEYRPMCVLGAKLLRSVM